MGMYHFWRRYKLVVTVALIAISPSVFSKELVANNLGKGLYPVDAIDSSYKITSSKSFIEAYESQIGNKLVKGEYESQADYENRIYSAVKGSEIGRNIFAFELENVNIKYNPDKNFFIISSVDEEVFPEVTNNKLIITSYLNGVKSLLKVSPLSRSTKKYKASNAYGLKANILELSGRDFYVPLSDNIISQVTIDKSYQYSGRLTIPVDYETAKKNISCKKSVVFFAKISLPSGKSEEAEFGMIKSPKIDSPLSMIIYQKKIDMDVMKVALLCSGGDVLFEAKSNSF